MTQSATTNSADPGFPREEFGALVRRLPRYGRLAWALARDPRLSRLRRAAVMAGAAYVISPIDLVPGIIPVAGQLDDLLIALGVIRVALDGLKPEVRAERLAAAGLSQADLDADVRFAGTIVSWLGRSAAGAGRRAVSGAVATGARAGNRLLQAGRGIRERVGRPGGKVTVPPTTETGGDR